MDDAGCAGQASRRRLGGRGGGALQPDDGPALRDRPEGLPDPARGRQHSLGLPEPRRREDHRQDQGARRHFGHRDLASALLLLHARMERGLRRCAHPDPRGRCVVGAASRRGGEAVVGRAVRGRRGDDDPLRRTFRRGQRPPLSLARRRPGRPSVGRHDPGGAGPQARQFHVQLSEPRSARRRCGSIHRRGGRAVRVRSHLRRLRRAHHRAGRQGRRPPIAQSAISRRSATTRTEPRPPGPRFSRTRGRRRLSSWSRPRRAARRSPSGPVRDSGTGRRRRGRTRPRRTRPGPWSSYRAGSSARRR